MRRKQSPYRQKLRKAETKRMAKGVGTTPWVRTFTPQEVDAMIAKSNQRRKQHKAD